MLIMGHRIRIGGEQISLNANYPDADKFRASGYEEITTNDTYKGVSRPPVRRLLLLARLRRWTCRYASVSIICL